MICFFIFAILIPLIDLSIKFWIQNNICENTALGTILPFFSITYVKNFGAALSLFSGGRYFLIITSVLAILLLLYAIFIKKIKDKLFLLASSFVIGGGIGNLVDRIFLGYVVDYLKISFFPPVCNISDYFITFGMIIFAFYFLIKKD